MAANKRKSPIINGFEPNSRKKGKLHFCSLFPLEGTPLPLAIFDLDETLIGIDSDHAWGEYVAEQGLVDALQHRAENQRFYEDYKQGQLDINAYFEFSCRVLTQHPVSVLHQHRGRFIDEIIKPHVLPKATALVAAERAAGNHRDGHALLLWRYHARCYTGVS